MTSYNFEDTPIKEVPNKSLGKQVDRKIRDLTSYIDPYDMDDLEFEEEIETFERIKSKSKKKTK